MKIRYTYLLLLCLLSFKGYSHIAVKAGKTSFEKVSVTKTGFIKQLMAEEEQPPSLFFDDNNEDDEMVIEKKELFFTDACPIQNDLAAVSNILHSYRKYQPVWHLFNNSLSRKYIALSVFRI